MTAKQIVRPRRPQTPPPVPLPGVSGHRIADSAVISVNGADIPDWWNAGVVHARARLSLHCIASAARDDCPEPGRQRSAAALIANSKGRPPLQRLNPIGHAARSL